MTKPTLFTSPHRTLYFFTIIIFQFLKKIEAYLLKFWYVATIVLAITVAPRFVEGQH